MAEWSSKQVGALGRFHHERGEYPYWQGCVFTPYGIVAVYYEPRNKSSPAYMNMDFIHNGRRTNRVMRKPLTERGLATVAHRFAKEIAT